MLYLPWRDESTDLLGGYMDFRSHYEDKSDDILANEQKYSVNATLIGEAMDDLHERGPPQLAWDQVAPGAAEQDARDRAEGAKEERTIEQEDLDANARLFQQQQQTSVPLLQRFTAEGAPQSRRLPHCNQGPQQQAETGSHVQQGMVQESCDSTEEW